MDIYYEETKLRAWAEKCVKSAEIYENKVIKVKDAFSQKVPKLLYNVLFQEFTPHEDMKKSLEEFFMEIEIEKYSAQTINPDMYNELFSNF